MMRIHRCPMRLACGWHSCACGAKQHDSIRARLRDRHQDLVIEFTRLGGCAHQLELSSAGRQPGHGVARGRGLVDVKVCDSVSAARADIADCVGWYNAARARPRLEAGLL